MLSCYNLRADQSVLNVNAGVAANSASARIEILGVHLQTMILERMDGI